MTDILDRRLALANPITDQSVRRLVGPDARTALLADITGGAIEADAFVPGSDAARPARREPRALLVPALAAAGVAAVVVLTAVALRDAAAPDRTSSTSVAAPAPTLTDCSAAQMPGTPQVAESGADAVFCVHAPAQEEMTAAALAAGPPGGTSPTAWFALSVDGGPFDVLALVVVSPVPSTSDDEVVVLARTSDAFPDDALDREGAAVPTHRVFGLAGEEVTGVEVLLPDGAAVPAALADGVWGAWWPVDLGGPDEAQVRVSTTGGTTTTALADVSVPEGPRSGDVPAPFRPQSGE